MAQTVCEVHQHNDDKSCHYRSERDNLVVNHEDQFYIEIAHSLAKATLT